MPLTRTVAHIGASTHTQKNWETQEQNKKILYLCVNQFLLINKRKKKNCQTHSGKKTSKIGVKTRGFTPCTCCLTLSSKAASFKETVTFFFRTIVQQLFLDIENPGPYQLGLHTVDSGLLHILLPPHLSCGFPCRLLRVPATHLNQD